MSIFRKFLILLILLLFSIVLYKLLQRRKVILRNIEETQKSREGYQVKPEPDVRRHLKTIMVDNTDPSLQLTLQKVSDVNTSLSLNQFCMKGSHNTAYIHNSISSEMVKYVLSRGCRVLDFEVYYLQDTTSGTPSPYEARVGYNADNTAVNSTSKNTVPLRDILENTLQFAFTNQIWTAPDNASYTCPNIKDPLFIQLRMKTGASDKFALYDLIQKCINMLYCDNNYRDFFGTSRTANAIGPQTQMIEIMGTVVFLFEFDDGMYATSNNFYNNLLSVDTSQCTSNSNGLYLNSMVVNSGKLDILHYSDIDVKLNVADRPLINDTNSANITKWMMVVPDRPLPSTLTNVDIYTSVGIYGYQINMMQYGVNDIYLRNSEVMFNVIKGAIIPLASAIRYIDNNVVKPA